MLCDGGILARSWYAGFRFVGQTTPMSSRHAIDIVYCPRCGWLLRAAWMAQELLATFWEELAAVSLSPAEKGGAFEIKIDGSLVWSRGEMGRFPDIAELKRLVRDQVAPGRDLGHIDHKTG